MLTSGSRGRPRLRRLIADGARRALAAIGEPATPSPERTIDSELSDSAGSASGGNSGNPDAQLDETNTPRPSERAEIPGPPPGASARFAREIDTTWLAVEEFLATRRLYDRLDKSDVAEIEDLISKEPDLAAYYDAIPDEGSRRHMVLAFGIWLGHPSATARTGLPVPHPPQEVHAMAHGPVAAAGGVYEADMVANALASVGRDIDDVSDALDFGCSSGRVVRVLAASYPNVHWLACDPNADAIAWASENLPGIEFFTSGDVPPLPLADGSLDLAYAISIWSHFEPTLGLRWFEEMHRVLRPGGHLVATTHGATSIAYYGLRYLRSPQQLDEIVVDLYRKGWWYAPEFGEEGDWGVVNPDWGTAFVSPEWLLTQLLPRWRVLEFVPGRNQDNQDIYVLERI
jgi:SAM-dependent methyltransferase